VTRTVQPDLLPAFEDITARLAREFDGVHARETVSAVVKESWAPFDDARNTSFVPLFVERFARQRLRARARGGHADGTATPMVVFLCVHNAGRSQMAAGWLEHLGGPGVEVFSGGSDPAGEVNPAAIDAMAEVGIDIAQQFPKPWTDDVLRAADVIVTMGCGDTCPVFPGVRYLDWQIDDPAGLGAAQVRPIRDDIEGRVRALMGELGIEERKA
jgi:protein-tyrosine-phosphatase